MRDVKEEEGVGIEVERVYWEMRPFDGGVMVRVFVYVVQRPHTAEEADLWGPTLAARSLGLGSGTWPQ